MRYSSAFRRGNVVHALPVPTLSLQSRARAGLRDPRLMRHMAHMEGELLTLRAQLARRADSAGHSQSSLGNSTDQGGAIQALLARIDSLEQLIREGGGSEQARLQEVGNMVSGPFGEGARRPRHLTIPQPLEEDNSAKDEQRSEVLAQILSSNIELRRSLAARTAGA